MRKKHYIASEVAELLGVDIDQVYQLLKDETISGYKTHSGKWLIPKDQDAFAKNAASKPDETTSFIKYIRDIQLKA